MPTRAHPNVLVVVLDSVRAASCSLYDADHDTTPFLESYAEEATVYDQARAPSNWTLPSHVSMFTGLDAHVHGVGIDDRLAAGHTVFERLADRYGFETGLFTENGFVASHDVGLHRAFGTVETIPETTPADYDTREQSPGPDGFYYAEQCLDWVDAADGPWAACVNLMDAHRPYEPRPAYDRWASETDREIQADLPVRWEWAFHGDDAPMWYLHALQSLYEGGIRQDDAVLRRLLDGLRARGVHDDTLVVVVGDHGEGLGEPGQLATEPAAVGHIVPMHETLLHVPLVVSAPGQRQGERVSAPATPTRLPSVVEAYVGRGASGPDRGRFVPSGPVVASKQPVTADLRDRYEDACSDPDRFTAPSRAIYEAGADGSVDKRYYWGEVAGEVRVDGPRSITGGGTASKRLVESWFDTDQPVSVTAEQGVEADPETEAQLAALGYY